MELSTAGTRAEPLITPAMLAQFRDEGYVVVDGVFDADTDLAAGMADYSALLDELAEEWLAAGLLTDSFRGLPFAQRLMRIMQTGGINWSQPFDISLPQTQVYPDTPIHTSAAVFALLRHPRLLDAV